MSPPPPRISPAESCTSPLPPSPPLQGFPGWIVQVIRYMILCNGFIPISLYITLEVVKVLQCVMVLNSDLLMWVRGGGVRAPGVANPGNISQPVHYCRCSFPPITHSLRSLLPLLLSAHPAIPPPTAGTIARLTHASTATPPPSTRIWGRWAGPPVSAVIILDCV